MTNHRVKTMDKDNVFSEIQDALQGKKFTSITEAQTFVDRFKQRHNQTPCPEFQGLSPDQMHRFLISPFDTPELVSFISPLETKPEAPIATLFNLLAEAIGEKGLKATANGNLPRNFCQ